MVDIAALAEERGVTPGGATPGRSTPGMTPGRFMSPSQMQSPLGMSPFNDGQMLLSPAAGAEAFSAAQGAGYSPASLSSRRPPGVLPNIPSLFPTSAA